MQPTTKINGEFLHVHSIPNNNVHDYKYIKEHVMFWSTVYGKTSIVRVESDY